MTSDQVLEMVVAALIGRTDAQDRVYSPRKLPTVEGSAPMLMVDADEESGMSISGTVGTPTFVVDTTVRIVGRMQVAASEDDVHSAQLSIAIGALRDQIKGAIGSRLMAPIGPVQAIPRFRATKEYGPVQGLLAAGQIVVEVTLSHFQGPDEWPPADGVPLQEIRAVVATPMGTTPTGVDVIF